MSLSRRMLTTQISIPDFESILDVTEIINRLMIQAVYFVIGESGNREIFVGL